MITYEVIKKMIEEKSKIEDISVESRERHYVHLRSVYYKLSYIFHPNFRQQDCADEIGTTHATVIYHLNDFDSLFNHYSFDYRNLYHDLYYQLANIYKNGSVKLVKPVTSWSKFKLMTIIDSKSLKISKQRYEITRLQKQLDNILSLKVVC